MSGPLPEPELTVVVPTWNRRRRLVRLLDSLAAQTLDPRRFEVVVVDDGSTDGTTAAVRAFAAAHPDLRLEVVTQANGGVNAARNAGIAASSATVVAFIDDDEVAPVDHLERLVAVLRDHPDVDGVGGPCIGVPGDRNRTCGRCPLGDASVPTTDDGRVHRLLGGNMAIRRRAFDEVGPFDAAISGRGDETEWFERAHRVHLYRDDLYLWHRRDDQSLLELCRIGFRQGLAMPLAHAKMGDGWRPSRQRLVRTLAHGVRHRCTVGALQASREAGAFVGAVRLGRREDPLSR